MKDLDRDFAQILERDNLLSDSAPTAKVNLKPPSLFKSHRRRSKTYSGEEFAVHLEKIVQSTSVSTSNKDKATLDAPSNVNAGSGQTSQEALNNRR